MKRRGFVKTFFAAPAATALLAQQPPASTPVNSALPVQPPARAAEELPKLEPSIPDAAAEMKPRFFTPAQFSALSRLSDLLAPAANGVPGAVAVQAPEFLDFLIGESGQDRKDIYRNGLDALNRESQAKSGKTFAEADAPTAEALLAPLRQPWTYDSPAAPIAKMLREAKQDIRTAAQNTREYAQAGPAGARRGGGGVYWYPLD